jgi:hypothetical protein
MEKIEQIADGPNGSGSDIIASEKRHRLTRMADNLARDLMVRDDLTADQRAECIDRISRWRGQSCT